MGDVEAIVLVGCIAPLLTFFIAIMWCSFRVDDRDSTSRHPRPGTQPFRPQSKIRPFRRHPDMLTDEESKNP